MNLKNPAAPIFSIILKFKVEATTPNNTLRDARGTQVRMLGDVASSFAQLHRRMKACGDDLVAPIDLESIVDRRSLAAAAAPAGLFGIGRTALKRPFDRSAGLIRVSFVFVRSCPCGGCRV